jgi:hypothetical protein
MSNGKTNCGLSFLSTTNYLQSQKFYKINIQTLAVMIIVAEYSFKNGKDYILKNHPAEFEQVKEVIASVDGTILKTKVSKEKTMPGQALYSPIALNKAFNAEFEKRGWTVKKANRIIVKTNVP